METISEDMGKTSGNKNANESEAYMSIQGRGRRSNPEGRLLLRCIKLLRCAGWECGKVKTKGSFYKGRFIKDQYQFIGLPDAFAFRKGIALAIETKAGSNKPTPEQDKFAALWDNGNDRLYLVVRHEDELKKYWNSEPPAQCGNGKGTK